MNASESHWMHLNTSGPTPRVNIAPKSYIHVVIVMELVLVGGIPSNILTILAFCRSHLLHTPTNCIICSLAVTDLITCLVSHISTICNYTAIGQEAMGTNKYLCLVSLWSVMTFWKMSLLHLLALSLDRLVAVVWALHYLTYVTEVLVLRLIIGMWVCMLFITSLPMIGWNTWTPGVRCNGTNVVPDALRLVYALIIFATLLAIGCLNVIVVKIAYKKSRVAPCETIRPLTQNNFKITRMLLTVVGINYVTWVPIIVSSIAIVLVTSFGDFSSEMEIVRVISVSLPSVNLLTNPWVYAWRDCTFRKAYKKVLRCST